MNTRRRTNSYKGLCIDELLERFFECASQPITHDGHVGYPISIGNDVGYILQTMKNKYGEDDRYRALMYLGKEALSSQSPHHLVIERPQGSSDKKKHYLYYAVEPVYTQDNLKWAMREMEFDENDDADDTCLADNTSTTTSTCHNTSTATSNTASTSLTISLTISLTLTVRESKNQSYCQLQRLSMSSCRGWSIKRVKANTSKSRMN